MLARTMNARYGENSGRIRPSTETLQTLNLISKMSPWTPPSVGRLGGSISPFPARILPLKKTARDSPVDVTNFFPSLRPLLEANLS